LRVGTVRHGLQRWDGALSTVLGGESQPQTLADRRTSENMQARESKIERIKQIFTVRRYA